MRQLHINGRVGVKHFPNDSRIVGTLCTVLPLPPTSPHSLSTYFPLSFSAFLPLSMSCKKIVGAELVARSKVILFSDICTYGLYKAHLPLASLAHD